MGFEGHPFLFSCNQLWKENLPSVGLYLSNSGMEQEGQEPCLLWLLTLGLVSTDLPLKAPGREGETNITGFFFYLPTALPTFSLCPWPLRHPGVLSQPSCSPVFFSFKILPHCFNVSCIYHKFLSSPSLTHQSCKWPLAPCFSPQGKYSLLVY